MPISLQLTNNFQKIRQLLLGSDLSIQERDDLLATLSRATNEQLEPLVALFVEDSSWIRKISQNYKAKQAALVTGNQALWQKIVQEEEAQLKELEY